MSLSSGQAPKDAIKRIKGVRRTRIYPCEFAVDISKYFDTLNHEKLLNLLRKESKRRKEVIQWIKEMSERGWVMEKLE